MTQPPKTSKTKDTHTHHSSPTGMKQTPMPITPPPKNALAREVTGTVRTPTFPPHVTKHPNPVGRPKGSVTTGKPAAQEMARMEKDAKDY